MIRSEHGQKTTVGLRPETSDDPCSWSTCTNRSSNYFSVSLCDDHMALIWSIVNDPSADRWRAMNIGAKQVIEAQDTDELARRTGWVYYLRIDDRLKIGYTKNLPVRMRHYPPNSVLMAAHHGTKDDEAALHGILTASRRDGREWYAFTEEITKLLREVSEKHGPPPNIDIWTRSSQTKPQMRANYGPMKVG